MNERMDERGVSVSEHAHDRNVSVNKLIAAKGVRNVNDRWHVAKGVKEGMKKIASGTKKTAYSSWHPELSDKTASVRDHVYWCIDNCKGKPDTLRELLEICILHFQNDHSKCDASSPCKKVSYIPDFIIVKDPVAVSLLTNFIKNTTILQ